MVSVLAWGLTISAGYLSGSSAVADSSVDLGCEALSSAISGSFSGYVVAVDWAVVLVTLHECSGGRANAAYSSDFAFPGCGSCD